MKKRGFRDIVELAVKLAQDQNPPMIHGKIEDTDGLRLALGAGGPEEFFIYISPRYPWCSYHIRVCDKEGVRPPGGMERGICFEDTVKILQNFFLRHDGKKISDENLMRDVVLAPFDETVDLAL